MKRLSNFFQELITGYSHYTANNLSDYSSNYNLVSGRNGLITGIYGIYELNIEKESKFEIINLENNRLVITYICNLEKELSLNNIFDIPNPKYDLVNSFTKEQLEVNLDIERLINTTPDFVNYPDKSKIIPIFDPILFYSKKRNIHLITAWNNKRTIQKIFLKNEDIPLVDRLITNY